jgi:hypothetical protein
MRRNLPWLLLALSAGLLSWAMGQPVAGAALPQDAIRVAVIGDYGAAERNPAEATAEASVAALVADWAPDYIVTTGDNNYPIGAAETIDANIGQFYHSFIYPYTGTYGTGAPGGANRFFPSLGNHDYLSANAQAYVDFFGLPGNERYYEFEWGPIHWFILDADPILRGVEISATQALWLHQGLAASTAPWRIVVMHQAPLSSGLHGSYPELQWPFADWGADAVLAGHDHDYERILRDGAAYFVNGSGGASLYPLGPPFTQPIPGSQVRYWAQHGAMLIEASATHIKFQFITAAGTVIDTYQIGWPADAHLVWLPALRH